MIIENIKEAQTRALIESDLKEERLGKTFMFEEDKGRSKTIKNHIWVQKMGGIRDLLLKESHKTMYFIHPGSTKMYLVLKPYYWWST